MTSVALGLGREQFEPALIAALTADAGGLHLARRCVDATDLEAVATAGLVQCALVGPRLARVDGATLDRIRAAEVAIVGVINRDDVVARERLMRWGVHEVVGIDPDDPTYGAVAVACAVGEAVVRVAKPASAHPTDRAPLGAPVTVVAGPAGAPGRTTIAVGLAAVIAANGSRVLLVDADTEAPSVGTTLGVTTSNSGLHTLCDRANSGGLHANDLNRVTQRVSDAAAIVTGTTWAESAHVMTPTAIEAVVALAATQYDHIVVDTTAWVPGSLDPASLSYRPILRAAFGLADNLIVAAHADPVGIVRCYAMLLATQHEAVAARHVLALNRVRPTALGGAESDVTSILSRHVALPTVRLLPDDRATCDDALLRGQPIPVVAPKQRLTSALRDIAEVCDLLVTGRTTTARRLASGRRGQPGTDVELAPTG